MDSAHENQSSETREKIKNRAENNEETNTLPKQIGIVFIEDVSDSKKTLNNNLKK